jgi:hypothetical protein
MYYKKILHELNHCNKIVEKTAVKKLQRHNEQYKKYIKDILPKLPKKAKSLFKQWGIFHDGALLFFSCGDIKWRQNFVEIKVERPSNGTKYSGIYILKYKDIRRCIFDFPSNKPMISEENSFGTWHCDELTLLKDQWMRHEILLISGATILIEFKRFSYSKMPCLTQKFIQAGNE